MKRRAKAAATVAAFDVPPELLDHAAEVWHNHTAHMAYMTAHGWDLDVRDRFEGSQTGAPPAARRQKATAGWALAHGLTSEMGSHPDWHRLRAMGLIE